MWFRYKKNKNNDIDKYIEEIEEESKEYKDIYNKLRLYYSNKNLNQNEIDTEISRLESKETIRANPMFGVVMSIIVLYISSLIDTVSPQFDILGNFISYTIKMILLILIFGITIKSMEKPYIELNRRIKFDKAAIRALKDIKSKKVNNKRRYIK